MRAFSRPLLAILPVLLLAGCVSTPESRAARNPGSFDRLPSAVQERVLEGRIALGDDEETVLLALGVPTRRVERTDAGGLSETWIYARSGPEFGFGFGVGSWGRHSRYGTHIETSLPPRRGGEWQRVEFEAGKVVRIDSDRGDRPRRGRRY
jgi:hypothetical protein